MLKSIKNLINNLVSNLRLPRSLYVSFDSNAEDKPVIILLHGIAATSKTWIPLIKELDIDKYRVISMDLLGFGKSPKPTNCEYSVDDHVAYIHRTIRKLRVIKPYTIVGHSMGSIIAARYCLTYPDDVKEVYLLSLPLYFKNSELHTNMSLRYTDFFLKMYELISQKKKFTIAISQRLRKFLRIDDGIEVNEENWNSFRLSLRNTIIKQNTYDDIKRLRLPVHVIYGSLDQFMVKNNVSKLKAFSNVKITRLKSVDHSIGTQFAKKVSEQISKYYL